MKHNKILTKAAFAALLVAANMPVDGQVEAAGIQETFLAAAGCSSCGGGRRSEIADNSTNGDMYNARTNSYQTNPNSSYSATGNSSPSMQGNSGNANNNTWRSSGNASGNASTDAWRTSGNAMNSNRTSNGSWSNTSTSGQSAYNVDVEVQRSGPRYTEEYSRTTTTMGNETITEEELLMKLSPQGKADYMSLDTRGKATALQLASQSSYQDKNMAVKEAKKRSQQGGMSNRY